MITADKVKNQIQTLIDTANQKTGNNDTDLSSAVGSLMDGYGSAEDLSELFDSIVFSYDGLKDRYEDITLNLINAKSISGLIDNKPIMFNKLTINVSNKCTTFQNAFRCNSVTDNSLKNLKTIVINGDTSNVTTFLNAFMGRTDLEEIVGDLNMISSTSNGNTFSNCEKLVNVRFVKDSITLKTSFAHCANLSMESADSIIAGLATVEESQLLSLPSHIKSQLSQTQIAQITSKNWTLA